VALIVGFPDIAASGVPSPTDLNTACAKVLEQIGGVTGDGTVYPGNLDGTNFAADAGFRNEQKLEPRSIFAVTVGASDVTGTATAIFNLPVDAELLSFGFCTDGTAVLDTYTAHLSVNEEEVRSIASTGALPAANTPVTWVEHRAIGAGAQVKVALENTLASGALDGVGFTFLFAAPHRRAP
jgi:hypothetical protein